MTIAAISNGDSGASVRTKLNQVIKQAPDCVVDAAGGGTHTTMEAAIAAAPSGGRIFQASDLTVAPGAGTILCQIDKPLVIDCEAGPGFGVRRIYNNGDGDVFGSNVPIGSDGSVNGVRIIGPYVSRSNSGRSLGRAFNMHGAFHWTIENPHIEKHAVGMYMDATPGTSGQCSHNAVWGGLITDCGKGIHNTGNANINSWHDLNISNCDVHIDHASGLNLFFGGLRLENLAAAIATPLVYARSGGLVINGLHAEAGPSVGAITIESGASGVIIDGDIYNTGGGTPFSIDGAARYSIRRKGLTLWEHGANRGQVCVQTRLPDVAVNDTITVCLMPVAGRIRAISLINNAFINYTAATTLWAVVFEEWNGNTKVGDIGTYTQAAQIGKGRVGVTGLDYAIGQDRTVRAAFTKTGSPSAFSYPLCSVEYDVQG